MSYASLIGCLIYARCIPGIKGGGGRVNDAAIGNETQAITSADLNEDGVIKLSAGKKRHALIKAV